MRKISAIKTDLSKNKIQKSTIEQQLKHTEITISQAATKLANTNKNIASQQSILQDLNFKQRKYENDIHLQRQYLLTQTRGVYLLGNNEPIKMLLNQEDPTKIERLMVYNQHLLKSRLQLITQIQQTVQQLKNNKFKIQKHTQVLVKLKNQQQDERNNLQQLKIKHIKILGSVKNKIQSQNEKLKVLLANKENLEKLIAKITAAKEKMRKMQKMKKIKIPKMLTKEKFIWPTAGKIQIHYGSSIEQSQWKWNGVVISAPEGQDIHAIAAGKIVYADWLAGYGLLLIIEHDHGFMSLYGRNHSIQKKLDEHVKTGEVIATVGRSGGYDDPSLYFGIRYYGKPVNPELWYKKI